jgi:hypothetical protein
MARFRHALLITWLVSKFLGFATFLLAVIAVVSAQFLPALRPWLPTWTVRVFVAVTLVSVGLTICLAIMRTFNTARAKNAPPM